MIATTEYILPIISHQGFPVAQMINNLPAMWVTWVRSLGWEEPLEEDMASHSSILAWRIPMDRSLAGYSPQGCKELDTTGQPESSSNPDRTSAAGRRHSLCCGPSLPGPSRWTQTL